MKRTLIYALTITAIALIGCSKEEVKTSATGMTLIANVNEPETSKATISEDWKFSFETNDVVKVTNTEISSYYTFTKGATNFTSDDAQTTAASADWSAFFPGNEFSLTGQSGTMSGVANYFGYAGKQTGVTAHSKTLNITMSPKMAILKVVNNKGSIQLRAKTSMGKYISCMIANPSGPSFTVGVSDDAVNLFSTSNTGTYYVAVPAAYIFDLYDGETLLMSIASNKLVAGKYYTLTIELTANCYIVSSAGTYKIKTVKGNSSESVGSVASAEVLWESFGTATKPTKGDLISSVSYSESEGKIIYTATGNKGNAVIAAKDASGKILWSWHIWLTDKPADQLYNNSAGIMMDRNLGATSATKGDVGALGLLYQWGRKDPFLGSSVKSVSGSTSPSKAASTITWPTAVKAAVAIGSGSNSLSYSVLNPTTFLKSTNPFDWYCTDSRNRNDHLWKNEYGSPKTIYDPCPAGYRVPDGGGSSVWITAGFPTARTFDSTNRGIDFNSYTTSASCWYPATGYLNDGDLSGLSTSAGMSVGACWSCTFEKATTKSYNLFFSSNTTNNVKPGNKAYYRSTGYSVRCLKE